MGNFMFLLLIVLSYWPCRGGGLPQNLNQDLYDACDRGNVEEVEKLLSLGADVNYNDIRSSFLTTALHISAVKGRTAVVSILLSQKGINVDARNDDGLTPLHYTAINSDRIQITKMLLNGGANINSVTIDKQTPLHKAAYWGNLEMVKLLLQRGADPSLRNMNGKDAYEEAINGKVNPKKLSQHPDEVISHLQEIKETQGIEESSLNYMLYGAGLVVLLVCVASGVWLLVGLPVPFARKPQSLISPAVVGPLLSNYTRDIDQTLDKKQGLAIVIGMSAVDGGKVDAKNMEEAFQELNFAVIKLLDVDINQLHAIIKAAASKLQAPSSIKATAVYFAGHGGSNSDKPFVVTKESAKMTVQDIVSPFYPVSAPHGKHLFFFDICLGLKVDPGVRDESSSTRDMPKLNLIPSHGNTLVAFANSIGFKVRGDQKEGGYWTRFLRKNIVKDQDIYMVLADTWTQTVQFTSKTGDQGVQGPSINACMGRFNLRHLEQSGDRAAPSQVSSSPQNLDQHALSHPPDMTNALKLGGSHWKRPPGPKGKQERNTLSNDSTEF